MTVSLADLVNRLREDVPPYDGVPTETQYARAVKQAVDDLASRRPPLRTTTLELVAGQADYTLPDDFLRLVSLTYPAAQGDTLVTGAGLVPLGLGGVYEERHDVLGLTLTITPAPSYAQTRQLRYAARYALTGSAGAEVYATLTEPLAEVALLKAQAIALRLQAQQVSRDAYAVRVVEDQVDKRAQAGAFREQAEAALARYAEALAAMSQVTGPADYSLTERAAVEDRY